MRRVCALLLLGVLSSGCFLRQAGKAVGDGFMDAVNAQGPTIAEGVVRGASEGLRKDVLSEETNQKLAGTVNTVSDAALAKVPELREQALGHATQAELRQMAELILATLEARSQRTSKTLMRDMGEGLRQEILNEATRVQLAALVEALGGAARGQTKLMRDDLLSEDTHKQVRVIVNEAMGAVVDGTERIRHQAHEELSFIQKNTAETLLVIAILSGLVIWWVYQQREKNRVLLNLLTQQLYQLSQARTGDAVFDRLKEQASEMGVERQFRQVMAQQGLLESQPAPAPKA